MEHFDVLIIGAGISGIGIACHLRRSVPDRSFVILEGRKALGGTWDLFRYPGIRSDSDMYTFGYAFKPWRSSRAIAPGGEILAYLHETVDEYDLHDSIRYQHRVIRVAWSSTDQRWQVRVRQPDGDEFDLTCQFLVTGTGYYDYRKGHTPDIEGLDTFEGTLVHPQHWPENLDYAGKRVVVVGSGATAMTLVPAMAPTAEHVTMVQRTPTYVISRPGRDPVAARLPRWLPHGFAHGLVRAKNILMGTLLYNFAKRWPDRMRRRLMSEAQEALGDRVDVDVHFNPPYGPWDQRLCLIPDGDLFDVLSSGQASIVTDTIERITPTGIRLTSGQTLDADVLVTATGLQLQFLGGIQMAIDGRAVEASELVTYRGAMFGNVPNWIAVIGYTSASWTLKVDLVAEYLCRLLRFMNRRGHQVATPVLASQPEVRPYMANLAHAGYVRRSAKIMPKQGTDAPWRNHDAFFADVASLRFARLDDGVLRFEGEAHPAVSAQVVHAS